MPRCGECVHLKEGVYCEIDGNNVYDDEREYQDWEEMPCPYYVPEHEEAEA